MRTPTLVTLAAACALASCDFTDRSPKPSCATATDCDDGLSCTLDTCVADADGKLFCAWQIAPGTCFVNGVCAMDRQPQSNDRCHVCDASNPTAWADAEAGTSCDDGSACTHDDTCNAGVCGGALVDCGDANACTRDACDPTTGCTHAALDGFSCDDGARCTLDDRCHVATCAGAPDACDDGDPCTADACNEVEGCTHTPGDLACDDGDACTASDTCTSGVCEPGPPTDCDDHNACTIDTCDPLAGCVHLPAQSPCCIGETSICDDGNACTDDVCDPATAACTHVDNAAPCDDADPCTTADTCAAGVCRGGPDATCDDANDCTTDVCNADFPGLCLHQVREGACDDGLACSTDDACVAGVCRGDTSTCVCVPDLASDGAKLTTLQIGASATIGHGVDVDGDPTTCAPNGCSDGIDNTLSILAGLANDPLAQSVANGQVLIVLAFSSLTASPVDVAVFQARLADDNTHCAVQTQTCAWLVDKSFLDPETCEPIAHIAATLDGTHLAGGGPGTRLPFAIPLNGASLDVVVANLRLEADVTIVDDQIVALTGVLGGAIPKATLIAGLQNLPDDALPISKDAAISLVDSVVDNDIDTDQDGEKDAASIGLELSAIDARLVGVTP